MNRSKLHNSVVSNCSVNVSENNSKTMTSNKLHNPVFASLARATSHTAAQLPSLQQLASEFALARTNAAAVAERDASRVLANRIRKIHALRSATVARYSSITTKRESVLRILPYGFTLADAQRIAIENTVLRHNAIARHSPDLIGATRVIGGKGKAHTVDAATTVTKKWIRAAKGTMGPVMLTDGKVASETPRETAVEVKVSAGAIHNFDGVADRAVNPLFDSYQRRYDAAQGTEGNAVAETLRFTVKGKGGAFQQSRTVWTFQRTQKVETFQSFVDRIAKELAETKIRRSVIPVEHLRMDLETEAASAIGDYLARLASRFPILCADLLSRFAIGLLPSRELPTVPLMRPKKTRKTLRVVRPYRIHTAMRKAAFHAMDERIARMSGRTKLVDTSFFNVWADTPNGMPAELNAIFVNSRIDEMITMARKRCSNGNERRSAKAAIKLLEQARIYFLESLGLGAKKGTIPQSELPFANLCMHKLHTREKRGKTRERNTAGRGRLANSALFFRILRMARFIGATDVQAALIRQSRDSKRVAR